MPKKKLCTLIFVVLCLSLLAGFSSSAARRRRPSQIRICGTQDRTVRAGSDFELKVTVNGEDDYLRWAITGKKGIIEFAESDRDDDEMEFHALKQGTTKVTCKIRGTSRKVTFRVTVQADNTDDSPQEITAAFPSSVTIRVGKEVELKVRKSSRSIKDYQLKWEIEDTAIADFDDDDYDAMYDDEADIVGLTPGTTKVTCTYLPTGQTVSCTVKVTAAAAGHHQLHGHDHDDDWDDD